MKSSQPAPGHVAADMAGDMLREGFHSLIAEIPWRPRKGSRVGQSQLASPLAEKLRAPAFPKKHVRRPAIGVREWFDALHEDSAITGTFRTPEFPKRHVRRPALGAREWYDLLGNESDTSEAEAENGEENQRQPTHTSDSSLKSITVTERLQRRSLKCGRCCHCRNFLPQDGGASSIPQAVELAVFPCDTRTKHSVFAASPAEMDGTPFTIRGYAAHCTDQSQDSHGRSHPKDGCVHISQLFASDESSSTVHPEELLLSRSSLSATDGSIDLPLQGLSTLHEVPLLHIQIPNCRMSGCIPIEGDCAGSSLLARRNIVLPRLKPTCESTTENGTPGDAVGVP